MERKITRKKKVTKLLKKLWEKEKQIVLIININKPKEAISVH